MAWRWTYWKWARAVSSESQNFRCGPLYSYPTRGRPSRAAPFHRTAEDGELLPKSDIVKSQFATSLEGGDESANKRRNQAGMVPADRRLIKFGAPG